MTGIPPNATPDEMVFAVALGYLIIGIGGWLAIHAFRWLTRDRRPTVGGRRG